MVNSFPENIPIDDIAQLPLGAFSGVIEVIDDDASLARAYEHLSTQQVIGFDSETRPTFKAGALNKVALLQLSTADKCYLIRLCKLGLAKQVVKLLEDKRILKVGADVKGDLRALQQLRKFRPGGFVDLQSIVPEWGISDKSVKKMAAIIMGVRISKAQRLSNWEASSLTPAQQMYAATDAWICLEMYLRLSRIDKKQIQSAQATYPARIT